jgi:IS5 family transposase
MLKQLKTLVGRVYRDIDRQLLDQSDAVKLAFKDSLEKTQRILTQQTQDKSKLYSFHAPEVECIAKGKVRKKYEFGVKVGIVWLACASNHRCSSSQPSTPRPGKVQRNNLGQSKNGPDDRLKKLFCGR